MSEFLIKYGVQLLFTIVSAALTAVFGIMKNLRKRTKALESGTRCLLRADIIRSHDKYVQQEYCPIYAKESLEHSYNAYHDLGGNGVVTGLMDDIRDLPVRR